MAREPASVKKDQIGFSPEIEVFDLEEFKGLNTQARRPSIEDQQMSWIENWMPIGAGNCRTMYGQSPTIYAAAGGRQIVWFFAFNIGAAPNIAVFLDDGTAFQVNIINSAVTTISAAAGTFYNGGSLPHAVQWSSSGILIVTQASANGFFAWDGTTLFKPDDFAPPWLSGSPGHITLTGTTNSNQSITAVSPNPLNAGVIVGMGIISNTGDIPAGTTVTAGTATTLGISNNATASNVGETLTVDWIMPRGIQGTAIETFLSRVWIINGSNLITSAPGVGVAFAGGNGGAIRPSNDSNLRVIYVALREANGFLYVVADSSLYYITNVQTSTSGTIPVTTYQYTAIDEQIGSSWRDTVISFGRSLMFANPNGVFGVFGSSATKISDNLDGLFASADFATVTPSMSVATMFSIRVALLNFRTIDYLGVARNIMAVFDGKKWWLGSQVTPPVFIAQQELFSLMATFGTDRNTIYQCFMRASPSLTKVIRSKLWGGGYGILAFKNAMRGYIQMESLLSTAIATIFMKIDNEYGPISASPQIVFDGSLTFVNKNGGALQFQNNLNQNLNFYVTNVLDAQNAVGSGLLLGLTLTSNSPDVVLERVALSYINQTAFGS